MKWIAMAAIFACGTAVAPLTSAQAAGCIKGAVVGGVAGHFLGHHTVLGATAGCLIGHHEAYRHHRDYDDGYNYDHPAYR
jgi:uncharacterized protein YcfJ